jgi:predicted RND superfamily exporter protein
MKFQALNKIFNLSLQFPKRVVLVWILLLLGIFSQVKPFKMLITIDGLINENFETTKNYRELREKFEEGTPLLLLHENSLNAKDVCGVRSWISNLPKKEDHLLRSYSLFSLRKPELQTPKDEFSRLTFPPMLQIGCYPSQFLVLSNLSDTPWDGLIVNQKTKSFVTELRFKSLDGEKNFQSKVVPKVVENLRKEYPEELNKKTRWLGQAAYQYFMKEGLKLNNALNGLLLLIVLLLMRLFLGTWKSGFSFIGTLLLSAIFLFALMAVAGTPLDVLNNSLFILLSVASLGDFIFLCHHQQKNQCSWKESFERLLVPSFFTSLTTFLGFLSLRTSDLDIIQRLGIWAAISGVIEWLVLFSLLPAILSLKVDFQSFATNVPTKALTLLNRLEKVQLPKPILFSFFLIYLASPFSPNFFNINDNPTMLFPKSHPFYQGIQKLESSLGFSGEVSVIYKRKMSLDQDFVSLESVLTRIKRHPNVTKIESPQDLIEFTTQGFSPEIKDLINSNLKDTAAYKKLIHEDSLRAKIYLNKTSLRDINEMRKYVEEDLCAEKECALSGALVAYAEFSQTVPKTLLISLGTSLIMVLLVLLVLWRGKKDAPLWPLLVSGFWGVAFILVLLAVSQFKLNFVTCVVLAILVGMTGDNAIHFLLGGSDLKKGIEEKQGASVLTTTIMSLCCVVFFFFSFQPPRVLGILLIFGLWGSLAGDLWFLKSLVKTSPSNS